MILLSNVVHKVVRYHLIFFTSSSYLLFVPIETLLSSDREGNLFTAIVGKFANHSRDLVLWDPNIYSLFLPIVFNSSIR